MKCMKTFFLIVIERIFLKRLTQLLTMGGETINLLSTLRVGGKQIKI